MPVWVTSWTVNSRSCITKSTTSNACRRTGLRSSRWTKKRIRPSSIFTIRSRLWRASTPNQGACHVLLRDLPRTSICPRATQAGRGYQVINEKFLWLMTISPLLNVRMISNRPDHPATCRNKSNVCISKRKKSKNNWSRREISKMRSMKNTQSWRRGLRSQINSEILHDVRTKRQKN